jgi:hypothetical protein
MNDPTSTHFLNVDLDVVVDQEVNALVEAFAPDAWALNCMRTADGYFANLELASQPTDPESAIRKFVDLIQRLPSEARGLWNRASRRDFSIGVESGSKASTFEVALTPAVLALAAEVGARIVFTVYVHAQAPDPSEVR